MSGVFQALTFTFDLLLLEMSWPQIGSAKNEIAHFIFDIMLHIDPMWVDGAVSTAEGVDVNPQTLALSRGGACNNTPATVPGTRCTPSSRRRTQDFGHRPLAPWRPLHPPVACSAVRACRRQGCNVVEFGHQAVTAWLYKKSGDPAASASTNQPAKLNQPG